jgi:hypothetical protein
VLLPFVVVPPSCPAKLVASTEAFSSPQDQFFNLPFLNLLNLMNHPNLLLHHHCNNSHRQKLKVNHPRIIQLESQENPQLVSLHLLHIVIHTTCLLKYQYYLRSMVRCPSFCSRSPKPSPKIEGIRPTTARRSCCSLISASCRHRPLLNSRGFCSTSAK